MSRYVIAAAAVVAALMGTAFATGAVSSIVGPNGMINGCYKATAGEDDPSKGHLRVIPAGEACKSNELAIQWNQQGPMGDQGPQGETGPIGPQGPKGDEGPAGTFAGSFSSPNGQFSIAVTDTGIELKGPAASVKVGAGSAELATPSGSVRVTGAGSAIQGTMVTLNGCGMPIARMNDSIEGSWMGSHGLIGGAFGAGDVPIWIPGPQVHGRITRGSNTVCAG